MITCKTFVDKTKLAKDEHEALKETEERLRNAVDGYENRGILLQFYDETVASLLPN